jgi:hypothetical protein
MAKLYVIDHSLFGRVELEQPDEYGGLVSLNPVLFGKKHIQADLYYSAGGMAGLMQPSLDVFAQLVPRLEEFDCVVRERLLDKDIEEWLADRADVSVWSDDVKDEVRETLARVFPRVTTLTDVTRQDFLAALKLDRICFSLDKSGSGGAALTMDYRLLPIEIDGGVFAAKFDEVGAFIDIVTES